LTDTHNEYRLTNNYILWFLLDILEWCVYMKSIQVLEHLQKKWQNYSKCSINNKHTAALKVFSPYFMSAGKLNENHYQVQMEREYITVKLH
jgi:hypothetical protein